VITYNKFIYENKEYFEQFKNEEEVILLKILANKQMIGFLTSQDIKKN
jgi:hypothetical protein